jgi:hypothetical protein
MFFLRQVFDRVASWQFTGACLPDIMDLSKLKGLSST